MAITYVDTEVKNFLQETGHPAWRLDDNHPCYQMKREMINGKPTFHWNKKEAYRMYKWYIDGYHQTEILDEFGGKIYSHDFKEAVEKSHYLLDDGSASEETIKEMWAAVEMERKMTREEGNTDEE